MPQRRATSEEARFTSRLVFSLIVAEYREKLDRLHREHPLPDPAQAVLASMLEGLSSGR